MSVGTRSRAGRVERTRRSGAPLPQAWWTRIHVATLVVVASVLLVWDSRMIWFTDDWSFLDSSRSISRNGVQALFASYNQHWSLIPVAVYRGVLSVAGMHHYLPFAVPLVLAHVANLALTRVLMIRSGIAPGLATLLPLTFAFLASAYTDLLWGFPVNLVGAVTFGLAAAVCGARPGWGTGRTLAVSGFLLMSVATSDVGIGMTVAVALYALLTQGWRRAAVVAVLPAAAYITWFLSWGRQEAAACPGPLALSTMPVFFLKALEKGLSGLTAVPFGSAAVALALAYGVVTIVVARSWRRAAWVLGSALGCLTLYGLSSIGRSACLEDASRAPRYAYFAVLAVPLVGWALDRFWRRSRPATLVIASVLVVLSLTNLWQLRTLSTCRAERVQTSFAQLSWLPERPSVREPQATVAELSELQARSGLQLVPRATSYPEETGGC